MEFSRNGSAAGMDMSMPMETVYQSVPQGGMAPRNLSLQLLELFRFLYANSALQHAENALVQPSVQHVRKTTIFQEILQQHTQLIGVLAF